MTHPDFTTLFERAAGSLARSGQFEIQQHLGACERCARDAETARRIFETVRSDRMPEPPGELVRRAVALWRKERGRAARRLITVFRAVMTFDSFASPLPAGVRSGAISGRAVRARRMLYRAGDFDIDLELEPAVATRGRASLRGQVLPRSTAAVLPGGAKVNLDRRTGRGAGARIDSRGAFSVGSLAPGRYRLVVEGGALRLVVDRLDVH